MNDESLIIQCNRMFYPDEIEAIRKSIQKQMEEGVAIIPSGFEVIKKKAYWIKRVDIIHKAINPNKTFESLRGYYCSNCNAEALAEYASDEADYALSNYCPNCGAFMSEHISELKGENKP